MRIVHSIAAACLSGLLLGSLTFTPASVLARAPQDPEGTETNDQRELARTAFVLKDGGREWVYIRLTSAQYVQVKARRAGTVKVILTPRQRLALRRALNLSSPMGPISLRTDEKRMQFSQALGGRYLARPADKIRAWGARGGDETEMERDQPPDGLLAGMREIRH